MKRDVFLFYRNYYYFLLILCLVINPILSEADTEKTGSSEQVQCTVYSGVLDYQDICERHSSDIYVFNGDSFFSEFIRKVPPHALVILPETVVLDAPVHLREGQSLLPKDEHSMWEVVLSPYFDFLSLNGFLIRMTTNNSIRGLKVDATKFYNNPGFHHQIQKVHRPKAIKPWAFNLLDISDISDELNVSMRAIHLKGSDDFFSLISLNFKTEEKHEDFKRFEQFILKDAYLEANGALHALHTDAFGMKVVVKDSIITTNKTFPEYRHHAAPVDISTHAHTNALIIHNAHLAVRNNAETKDQSIVPHLLVTDNVRRVSLVDVLLNTGSLTSNTPYYLYGGFPDERHWIHPKYDFRSLWGTDHRIKPISVHHEGQDLPLMQSHGDIPEHQARKITKNFMANYGTTSGLHLLLPSYEVFANSQSPDRCLALCLIEARRTMPEEFKRSMCCVPESNVKIRPVSYCTCPSLSHVSKQHIGALKGDECHYYDEHSEHLACPYEQVIDYDTSSEELP